MKVLIYKNKAKKLPKRISQLWMNSTECRRAGTPNIINMSPMGLAYHIKDHHIHICVESKGLWPVLTGVTISQKSCCNLNEWVTKKFGANNIKQSANSVGEVVHGVWRPGLYSRNDLEALKVNTSDKSSAERALRILLGKLDKLFFFIEPSQRGLKVFSHKTRELLILACTEIENTWRQYMDMAGVKKTNNFTTNDYVQLLQPLFLKEYDLKLKLNNKKPLTIRPFKDWSQNQPTQTLPWYDAYNKTKHNRDKYFHEATLLNCINAIAGNIVLFCVRYSPYELFALENTISDLTSHFFEIQLIKPDPKTFYVPKIIFPEDYCEELVCLDARKIVQPWTTKQLKLKQKGSKQIRP